MRHGSDSTYVTWWVELTSTLLLPVAFPDGLLFRKNDHILLCVLLGLAYMSVKAPTIVYCTFCVASWVTSLPSPGLSLLIYKMGVIILLTSGSSCEDRVKAFEAPVTLGAQ